MKKVLRLFSRLLILIVLLIPSKALAATHEYWTNEFREFTTASLSDRSYYVGPSKSYYFRRMFYHEVIDNGKNYLAYCLDVNANAPGDGSPEAAGNVTSPSSLSNKSGVQITGTKLELLKNILASGYQYSGSVRNGIKFSSDTTMKKRVLATQILIWEVMEGGRSDYVPSHLNAPSPNTYQAVSTDSSLRSQYENILQNASKLAGNNKPSSFGKTHILHWNDARNAYVTSAGINIGDYQIDSYDTSKISVSSKDRSNNITISSSSVLSSPVQVNLKYINGTTSGNSFKIFTFNSNQAANQRMLLAYYQGKATGSLSVKTESGKFKITKKDSSTRKNIKGAVFNMYKCTTQAKCDFTKVVSTIDMRSREVSADVALTKSGLYLFRETTAPVGYEKIEDFYVRFTIGDDSSVKAEVSASNGRVTTNTESGVLNINIFDDARNFVIRKVDGRNTNIAVKGATFRIKKTDGTVMKFVKAAEGKYRYDASGTVTNLVSASLNSYSVSLLPVGEYVLEELAVPYPYVLSSNQAERETKFRIVNDTKDTTNYLQTYNYTTKKYVKNSSATVIVNNFKTRITITKTGPNAKVLPNVMFELYNSTKETQVPVKLVNGEYVYDSSATPIRLNTNTKGIIIINYLPEGTYYLKEVQTPVDSGIVIDPENQWTEMKVSITRTNATDNLHKQIRNAKGEFCFYKIDENGNYLDSGKFKLQMYNTKTSKYEDKSLIFNQDKTYSIDSTGKSSIYTFSPISGGQTCFVNIDGKGKYRIVELEAPKGFVIPSTSEKMAEISINEFGYAVGDAVIINKKITVGEEASAQAELIVNIQTGQTRIHYIITICGLIVVITGLIVLKNKIDKK